jgi:ferredoxin-NADP reductase
MKLLLLLAALFPSLSIAFISPSQQQAAAFRRVNSRMFAEGHAPQYDKVDAVLRQAETLSEGTVMLHIDSTTPIDYKPGHVIALEIENISNSEDAVKNGGWMRGPYTVSRASENSIDVLLKVVGDKSRAFAFAEPGTPLKFGGKFKVPIIDGIRKEDTKRVVFISTGVGVGPCVGAIEEGLKDSSFPSIELYASFKTSPEVVYADYLDGLVAEKFKWKAIVTSEIGRISATEDNVKLVAPSSGLSLNDTHYHLIGNGQMVNEWKAGLAKAGVPDEKVTVEMYFNHKEPANGDAIDNIAKVIAASCRTPVVV